ncbi:hypothetical protein [Acinetobacter terrestris]|uniref:hypothetical protein n=1 Tax=Acinetobacter terrestris TaxID=2529843 RepID=UPI001BE454C8|nr:hypothetical protein [Acinetobacter terrestris]
MALTVCQSVPATLASHAADQVHVIHSSSTSIQPEVAPCTNGFDGVNVCELLS